MSRAKRGFTLVELLVVIAIIGALMAMTIPAVRMVQENARKTSCANNVSNIVKALKNYESLHQVFPPGRVGCDDDETEFVCKGLKAYQRSSTSGFALILPQLDEKGVYDRLGGFRKGAILPSSANDDGGTKDWRNTIGAGVFSARPKVFVCPTSRAGATVLIDTGLSAGTSCYAMCMGSLGPRIASKNMAQVAYRNNGMFGYKTPRGDSAMTDGATQTILIGEATYATEGGYQNAWLIGTLLRHSLRSTEQYFNNRNADYIREDGNKPKYGQYIRGIFASQHYSGAFFGFGDSHVQFVNDKIDARAYVALGTRNGGEILRMNSTEEWEWISN